jgi:transposase
MGMRGRGGRDFGVGWATVMAAVREDGARLLRRAQLGAQASAIGVDETAFTRATALTATVFAPDVVDLHAGKLIDVLEVEPEKYWRTGFLSTSTVG